MVLDRQIWSSQKEPYNLTGGAAESIHPTTRKEKYIIEKTAGFKIILNKTELFGRHFCTLWQIIVFFGLCGIKLEILK